MKRFIVGLSATVLMSALVIVACNNDSPTIPDPSPVAEEPTQQHPSVAASPTPAPGDDRADGIHISPLGFVLNETGETLRACLYDAPYAAGKLLKGWKVRPGSGRTAPEWANETCDPVKVQLDVIGDATCPFRPNFVDYRDGRIFTLPAGKTGDECKECKEWSEPVIECGEYSECHEHPETELCYQEAQCVKKWNCKDPEPYEDVISCACPQCVEEGPYEGETVWSGEILKGACPEQFGTSCREECHELGKKTTKWDCKPDLTVGVCRPADCPVEGKGCHLSNQGAPGDTNFNVVLTNSRPHLRHTQQTHCPGDIFPPDDCTCEQALLQAQQCGDPAAGGFTCKDVR